MKKFVLIIMAVMAFAGMSVAQDVYSVGYYTSSGYTQPAVYKNNAKLYDWLNSGYDYKGTDVTRFNGDTYWSFNCTSTNDWAAVYKNGNRFLDLSIASGGYLRINGLCHGTNYVFAAGCSPSGGVTQATVWRGNATTPIATISSTYNSEALCCDYGNATLYYAGYQYTNSSDYAGKVWEEYGTEVYSHNNVYIRGIQVYEGSVYYIGTTGDGNTKVYRNGSEVYTINGWGQDICVDAGDIYVAGSSTSGCTDTKVWKNGALLYTQTGGTGCYAVAANTEGVYYGGKTSTGGKVWKNGSQLLAPSLNACVMGMYVDDPECEDDIFALPFTDGFENGSTHWPCWTVITSGSVGTGDYYPVWDRFGQCNMGSPSTHAYTGDYGVIHGYSSNSHTDWLISPRLFLQPGRDNTTLTFKCYRTQNSNPTLWISTTGNNTSNFTTQLTADWGATGGWRTVTVDLAEYQGEAVYIGFKYSGSTISSGLCWIDDFSVTESWSPCSTQSVPYLCSFDSEINWCWYIWDDDMTGGQKCWQYNSSNQCAYHPYGQNNGVPQYGCLISPNINLPSGHDYVLKFKTKTTSSGSNKQNKVYLKRDGSGVPNPSTYTTLLWTDTEFSSTWTEVEIPLSSHAGHTVSFSFEYYGTYAHNWFIDDVRVEQATAQYTITANSNNNAWGTVTGGGTYNAGATCTLHATPASGYQFDSWKKNGTVVSTNPNYSFTVTENATYTAYFSAEPVTYYTITTNVTPAGSGTVTGGGTYPAGSSVTLQATANTGYQFSQWNDGSTQNPRTITVTGNATYTATFTQLQYTINVYANPTYGGTVYGGGNYYYGETVTIGATPASGYEFAGWSDGNNDNPRTITVNGNHNYTAIFNEVGVTYYTVTTHVSPAGAGTVTGGGTYEEGTVVVLQATANTGYTFSQWNDGSTQNPRTITVTGNMDFTANFTHNQYTITVVASPATAGTVSGGGAYYYGDIASLQATAYTGYEFVGWSDGSTENPHNVTVTGNATYTATFSSAGTTYYTVTTYVSPAGAGTVSGAGTYAAGSTVTLQATANTGYTFDHWNDGSTQNPRTITVNNNMSFTAFFNTQQYTITVNANPTEGGTVTGGGSYAYGATATLQAIANSGYEFMQWSDGNVDNPRYVTVTGNATYTALFLSSGGDVYTLTVNTNNVFLGSVFGGGTYPAGSSVEISAYPSPQARFVKWDDGNTDNPRTVIVNSNMEFTAEFVATQNYTITVESANPEMGQAFGGGTFQEGTDVQIAAVAFGGYMFDKWQDGNTDNPRTITVTGNATYTASFKESTVVTYTLTLVCNTSEGSVSGGGVYLAGNTATIQAFPNEGYAFDKWSDENTDNPRTIVMTNDMTLVAFFKGTGVNELNQGNYMVFPNPATESIRIEGLEANTSIEIYNSLGELVKVVSVDASEEIGIKDLASGLYMVRFGNVTLRFVKTL